MGLRPPEHDSSTPTMITDYAESLFKRKLEKGELTSAKSHERWADTQDLHLVPYFGEFFVDAIRRTDIEE